MDNNRFIDMEAGLKEEQKGLGIELGMIPTIAILGGVKQLAYKNTYMLGLGAGLLFGKKAGIKTIGAIVGAGAVYNAARYMTGEFTWKK